MVSGSPSWGSCPKIRENQRRMEALAVSRRPSASSEQMMSSVLSTRLDSFCSLSRRLLRDCWSASRAESRARLCSQLSAQTPMMQRAAKRSPTWVMFPEPGGDQRLAWPRNQGWMAKAYTAMRRAKPNPPRAPSRKKASRVMRGLATCEAP